MSAGIDSTIIDHDALIFDLNGTMVDDMSFHLDVWFEVITKELGASLSVQELKQQMYGKNEEVLGRIFGPRRFSKDELAQIIRRKEERYQQVYLPHLKLIEGLPEVLNKAKAMGRPMAIGSAAPKFNVDFVLDNLNIREFFDCVLCGEDVHQSKPHPETFLNAASYLGVAPSKCLVFEDAPMGVEAAQNAGMSCVVITSQHGPEAFSRYSNVLLFAADYSGL
jgi:HAD superfamily hydrolase (TIGR01509 family)